jgi:hypothetical protein
MTAESNGAALVCLKDWPAYADDAHGGGGAAMSRPSPPDNVFWGQGQADSGVREEVAELRAQLAAMQSDLRTILAKL